MKFLSSAKDGGPESNVHGYWLVEIKSLFSIVLLKFEDGSRDAHHNHAFNSISWLLKGFLLENFLGGGYRPYFPSLTPIVTTRETFHKVYSLKTSWVLSFRGPWSPTWKEAVNDNVIILKHGRKRV